MTCCNSLPWLLGCGPTPTAADVRTAFSTKVHSMESRTSTSNSMSETISSDRSESENLKPATPPTSPASYSGHSRRVPISGAHLDDESESDLLFKQPPGKMDTQESLLVSQPTFSGISNILLKTGNSDMLVMRNPAVGTQATLRPPKKVSFAPKVEEIAVRGEEGVDILTPLDMNECINPHEIFFTGTGNGDLIRLGKGAFGTVYKGSWRNRTVAVKVCRQKQVTARSMQMFHKETSILRDCRHPNIVAFLGSCSWKGGKRTVLVTEFCENGDLCGAMWRWPELFAWQRMGRRVAMDVAKGIAFLHSRNIVHFDLKTSNILLDRNFVAKLADVGLAKKLTHYHGADDLNTFIDTHELPTFSYAAPEVLVGEACDHQADIFSYGVILWELSTTEIPQSRNLRPVKVPQEAPQEVADLIAACCRNEPHERPTARQIVHALQRIKTNP